MSIKRIINTYSTKTKNLVNKGAGHVVLGSFVTKFITFFGSIFLVRFLTKSEYGVLSYYENILGYFSIFSGMGFANGILRYLILVDDIGDKKGCYIMALKKGNLWNLLLFALSISFCFLYKHPESFQGYPLVFICLSLCIPLIYTTNLTLSSFRSLFDYKWYAYLAILTGFLLVFGRVVGAAIGGLNYSVKGRVLAEIICIVISVAAIYHYHFKGVTINKLEENFSKEFTNYSLQMMLTDGLWAIFMLNDMFLLGQMTGDEILIADYKIAYVIPANLSILASSICVFTAPYFTKKDKEGDTKWINSKLKETILVTMAVIGAAVLLCITFCEPIIKLIFGSQYVSAAPIMNVLLIASFFNNGIRMAIANFMSAVGEQKKNLIVAGIGIIVQVILDVILIPMLGAYGVGISSILVYLIMSTVLMFFVVKRLRRNISVNNK